eukprot:CAMPEP_0177483022 /NCGR_PEP_ID=MMETSP0369-20130122/27242_1 /TAXON_ID=447022 ORGANISM="Scrippsiella hangoei-like, Strain SHHI-4" /NCGR_SAMPLE_ID=MMETSP0369 /ASSEMBLY_ACC=CAM_ASM_000364 /LENGTH=47 /DNA_ID= /DNA_START= /DNA_END= /DNA_ORIENTATION=
MPAATSEAAAAWHLVAVGVEDRVRVLVLAHREDHLSGGQLVGEVRAA